MPQKYKLTRHVHVHADSGKITTMTFHRDSDGMLVAVCQNGEVIYGEDPINPMRRSFISQAWGIDFIKGLLRAKDGEDTEFPEIDGESRVITPGRKLHQ